MKTFPAEFRAGIRYAARLLPLAVALSSASCELWPMGPPPPGYPPPPPDDPRFGYRGRESPNYRDPRYADGQRKPRVKVKPHDPNNTTVDIDPPRDNDPPPTTDSTPPETPANTDTNPTPAPDTPPPADPPVATKPRPTEDLPYGTPVVGKPGRVYSPYAPDRGQVDVDGLKRGTKVKCPYTQKAFRVP